MTLPLSASGPRRPYWVMLPLLAVGCGTAVQANAGPRVDYLGGRYVVILPPAAEAALNAKYTGFTPWQPEDYAVWIYRDLKDSGRPPQSTVIIDFNGDGRLDVLIDGHTQTHEATIVLLSNGDEFEVVDVHPLAPLPADSILRRQGGRSHTISYYPIRRGRYEGNECMLTVTIRHDGVMVDYNEKGTTIIHFDGHRIMEASRGGC